MAVHFDENALRNRIGHAIMRGIFTGCEMLRTDIVDQLLDARKTGKIYMRRGVAHQASAPWESPATDTGRLVNSIEIALDVPRLVGVVNIAAEYAAFLEFGTRRMSPRPFARPALAQHHDRILEVVQAEVDRELAK
jgi:HK97 gp10 family phage protein